MTNLRYYLIYILATITRFFPLPIRTGIREMGHPDPSSPVLITGNYILTVELLKKELHGLNLYLLVANSRGINVWCAATGGHFTNHDIISVLKTSGIEQTVGHRNYILPQLAATGIEPRVIHKKTGWNGTWGPVRASDIRKFLDKPNISENGVRTVTFPLHDRLDMAVAWAFLMSVILTSVLVFLSFNATLVTIGLCWYLTLVMFISFPIFENWFQATSHEFLKTKVLYPLLMILSAVPAWLILVRFFALSSPFTVVVPVLGVTIVLMVNVDLKGSTPVFKSDLIADRIFEIQLDEDKCRGAGDCVKVCPKECFLLTDKKVSIPHPEWCVQCGACVVQCPFDALYLRNNDGRRLDSQILREHKLNLMGKRAIADNQ